MTHVCCPSCWLRFTPAAAATLEACPICGEPPHLAAAEAALGYRLVTAEELAVPFASVAAMPVPDLGETNP